MRAELFAGEEKLLHNMETIQEQSGEGRHINARRVYNNVQTTGNIQEQQHLV